MVEHTWQKPVKTGKVYGKGNRTCRITGNHRGLIRKYGLYVSRRCFREVYADLGFKKLN